MSGMRFGVIHSWNEKVLQCINAVSYFQSTPVYTQSLMTRLLSDRGKGGGPKSRYNQAFERPRFFILDQTEIGVD